MSCVSSTDGIPAGFQDLQNVCDHGFVTTTNMTFNSASPTLTLGAGTGSPNVIANKADAGQFTFIFQNAGVDTWALACLATEDLVISRYNAGGVFQDLTMISFAAHLWTYPGSATYSSASPVLTVGDGTGSPLIVLDKSDAGTADIGFRVAGVNRWIIQAAANEDWQLLRFNAAGAFQDSTYVSQATHLWTYPGSATYASASPIVTIGDATGSPSLYLTKSDAGSSVLSWYSNSQLCFRHVLNANEDYLIQRFTGASVFQDETVIYNATGLWQYPASALYNSASPVVTIGAGTGSPQLIINQSADETAYIEIQNAGGRLGRIYFGAGNPAIAAVNGDHYWDFDNSGNTIWKYVAGAWALQC